MQRATKLKPLAGTRDFLGKYGHTAAFVATIVVASVVTAFVSGTLAHWRLNTQLQKALELEDAVAVQRLVTAGADVEVRSKNGFTPLILAVRRRDTTLTAELLRRRANPNASDRRNFTPLLYSASTSISEQLLNAGASVNRRGGNGFLPLQFAIATRNREMVHLLLSRGADPNLLTGGGHPMLGIAPDTAIMRELLDAGANLELASSAGECRGWTALFFHAERGALEQTRFLVGRGAATDLRDARGRIAADYAGANGYYHIVRVLRSRAEHRP